MKIGHYSVDDYMLLVKSFHGTIAPGLLIGGFMVDYALKEFESISTMSAISETFTCLPDAIQLLTPCTAGNGRLNILDYGRFGLSFYENKNLQGIRVFLDHEKLIQWPEIYQWLFRLKPKEDHDLPALRDQIIDSNRAILSLEHVTIDESMLPQRKGGDHIRICSQCNEPFPGQIHDTTCFPCSSGNPYSEHFSDAVKNDFKLKLVKE